jgi:hypothetical protein
VAFIGQGGEKGDINGGIYLVVAFTSMTMESSEDLCLVLFCMSRGVERPLVDMADGHQGNQ